MSQHYTETKYGFEWGAAKVQRAFSDDKRGWITLTLETPKHAGHAGLQIYVTRTGKVRIHDARGEWSPPNAEAQRPAVAGTLPPLVGTLDRGTP